MSAIAVLLSTSSWTLPAAAYADDIPDSSVSLTSVDLRDLAQYAPTTFPEASTILSEMQRAPQKFFPAGVSMSSSGASQVFGIELSEPPAQSEDGSLHVRLTALIEANRNYSFRKMELTLAGTPRSVASIDSQEDFPLASAHFAIRASLIQRRAYLEDTQNGFRKIYPISVGGFDDGLTPMSHGRKELMTPTFSGAYLSRATSFAARTNPPNYRGLPFMPINRADGYRTPIAFHILQSEYPTLNRGFLSHGCMRLREKDLVEMYAILAHGGDDRIPVDVSLVLSDTDDHPYPLNDSSYFSVVNCAHPGQTPHSCKVFEGGEVLTHMALVQGAPPLGALLALNGDTMTHAEYAYSFDHDVIPEALQPFIQVMENLTP